jgi:hypothetical protein
MRPESYQVMAETSNGGERWIAGTAVLFIASMATLVQSYVTIKLLFLSLFLLVFLVNFVLRKTRVIVYRRLVWFYLWIGLAGVIWALVGLLHHRNYIEGIFDALRLYVVWSAAFVVLYTLLKAGPSLRFLHTAMVIAGILIPLINFVGVYDEFKGGGLFPRAFGRNSTCKSESWTASFRLPART